ncbi:excinuclease ABC subunit UvrA [Nonomuraea sp. NPDC002799]
MVDHTTNDDRVDWITVEGARRNNLRGVGVRVPKHRVTAFTGVSGSGKSSLAFDTIAAEGQRLVTETYPVFVRARLPKHAPAEVDRIDGLSFTTLVDQRPFSGGVRSTVATASDIAPLLRMLFSRAGAPSAGFTPSYSFNDPRGMCPGCEGLGIVDDIDLDALIDETKTLGEGPFRFSAFAPGTYRWKRLLHSGLADRDLRWADMPEAVRHDLLYARDMTLSSPGPEYPKSSTFDGVIPRLRDSYLRKTPSRLTPTEREGLARIITSGPCPQCDGTRLNEAARASLIDGRSITDWAAMSVAELRDVAAATKISEVAPLLASLARQLEALDEVGLGYLTLDRTSSTLSGGEAQRVKLVRHLGSALTDVTYVLDEPSAGLHPHDVHRLLDLLGRLRDAHNTVLVIEHHPDVIADADHVIDLGPGAGENGGSVEFEGTPAELYDSATVTGRALREPLVINECPRPARGQVTVTNAHSNNLAGITVEIPLGVFTVVSGVAGSGKTTLAAVELPRQHPEFSVIGQAPLRGGIRSTPVTVLGIADGIRRSFARANNMDPSWFSPNSRGGCPACNGKGVIVTDLAFLDDVETVCEACGGTRFSPDVLAATLRGFTIADVFAMRVDELSRLFRDDVDVVRKGQWLNRVGLGYLRIGQSLDTLSGGERQRLLLAKHLGEHPDPHALMIVLDEPTAGLHITDIDRILALIDDLVDGGATVVAIEHSRRVIAHADHVIDIGPGAGDKGGRVVFVGPPSRLADCDESLTAAHLIREKLR